MKFLRFLLALVLGCLMLVLISYVVEFCGGEIEPGTEYGFWYGWFHGMYSVGSFIRSWFVDVMCKADTCTTGYSIAYWITTISTIIGLLFRSLKFMLQKELDKVNEIIKAKE